jgi:hypothetical protein
MMIRVDQGKGRKDRYTILAKRLLEELLPVPYFHNVFTVPHELNRLFLSSEDNQRKMLNLLFSTVSETLLTFGRNNLGGRIGFTLVLHTWDQQLMAQPTDLGRRRKGPFLLSRPGGRGRRSDSLASGRPIHCPIPIARPSFQLHADPPLRLPGEPTEETGPGPLQGTVRRAGVSGAAPHDVEHRTVDAEAHRRGHHKMPSVRAWPSSKGRASTNADLYVSRYVITRPTMTPTITIPHTHSGNMCVLRPLQAVGHYRCAPPTRNRFTPPPVSALLLLRSPVDQPTSGPKILPAAIRRLDRHRIQILESA